MYMHSIKRQSIRLHRTMQEKRSHRLLSLLLLACLLLSGPATASQNTTIQGIQALKQGKMEAAAKLLSRSSDPLAVKLYDWFYYKKAPTKTIKYSEISQFIRDNPAWPDIKEIKLKAEDLMSSSMRAKDAVSWFNENPPLSTRGFFIYADSLLALGQTDKAKALIAEWWVDKPLTRNDQKKLYTKYHNHIDMSAHRRRLDNLIDKEQYSNARGVAGVLGPDYLQLTEARIALAEQKPDVNAALAQVPARLQNDPGLLFERLRWRRKKDLDDGAIEILNKEPDMRLVSNPEAWWQERHIIIRRLIENGQYLKAYNLAKAHKQKDGLGFAQAEFMAGWLALRYTSKPASALEHFERLYNNVETPLSKSRGAYWAGRAAGALGQPEVAREWYNRAARFQTTFYGQTAGAQLGIQTALSFAAPPDLTSADIQNFNQDELVRAAKLFHESGMRDERSKFLKAFADKDKTPKSYLFAAQIASDMGDYYDAVRISKDATKKGLFFTAQSYPVITRDLKNVSVDWALVHSLIRQESQFDVDARSPVGALGLMQLMPTTAQLTAKGLGIGYNQSKLTADPSYNIKLGSEYLRKMLARFGGSYPLAIAAYNAGPNRVDKWLQIYGDPRLGQVDLIDWIETIPIYETRNYVQRVMEGVYVYHLRLKDTAPNTRQPVHVARVY